MLVANIGFGHPPHGRLGAMAYGVKGSSCREEIYSTQEVTRQMVIAALGLSTQVDNVGPAGQHPCFVHVNVADEETAVVGAISV